MVIDSLVEHDVVVVDLFGKIRDGTSAGDTLSTAIRARCRPVRNCGAEGTYTSAQLDRATWAEAIEADFVTWRSELQ